MRRAFPLLLAALAGCAQERPAPPPPATEFLVSAGDSTYWVRTGSGTPVVRSSPILLARFDGRFFEVYVTDDDRSYEDAVFVGQRLWRRDIVTGDSLLVWEDSTIPRLAARWGAEHPASRRLAPDEEEGEDPARQATSELSVLEVHGAYLAYEYHADLEQPDAPMWHTTRRGVIDLRAGRAVSVAELFGAGPARVAGVRGRRAYLAALDSVRAARSNGGRALAASLDAFDFDDRSFVVSSVGGAPAVAYHVPGKGAGTAGGLTIPLPPFPVSSPPWWGEIREGLPQATPDSLAEQWRRGGYSVTARYRDDERAALLLEAEGQRWELGSVQGPVRMIYWLDRPALGSPARKALARAFDEAAFYDENVRTASWNPRPRETPRPSSPT